MNKPIAISVDQAYPFPIREGVAVSFLLSSGNAMQIGLSDLTSEEIGAFRKSKIKLGILVDQPVVLWLFDFGLGGQYDSPFDVRLYDKNQLALPSILNSEQRLSVDMHVVDIATNITKVIRFFTIPSELTLEFLSATQDQLARPFSQIEFNKKLDEIFKQPVDVLIKKTKMYEGGT